MVPIQGLFHTMAKGGLFGHHKIRHFNGHLFEDATVFELNDDERRLLVDAAEADWQFVEPSIMGTLFARGLDPGQRAALGAQYTGRDDIVTLVEPVLMAPLRREWTKLKTELTTDGADFTDKQAPALSSVSAAVRAKLEAFLKKLRAIIVMDPTCGSGNFLYVSLQMLLDLEKEVITLAAQLGFQFQPEVGVHQLRAIEINPYAYELAQVTVQIGYLQWLRANGFPLDRSPVLQVLDGFQNEDALLVPHFHSKAKTLKEAQAGEHAEDTALKFYTEREWPKCDVIVGNPPFLGDKLMRGELGDGYVEELRRIYGNRIPGQSDLCCYWFEKAREQIEQVKCKRAGLLATQGIRGGANREVLKRIKAAGDIFFAESNREWTLDGASVHVSMVGFDNGSEPERRLDGNSVATIHPQLIADTPTASSTPLHENESVCFIGTTKKAALDVSEERGLDFLHAPNPTGKPNSDIVLPWMNGLHVTRRTARTWIIDFPMGMDLTEATGYAEPFAYIEEHVKPLRVNHREAVQAKYWWRQARPCPELRALTQKFARYCVTPRVAKHRIVSWVDAVIVPDCQLVAFARDDDFFFGVLHSRFHEVWALKQGTRLETRPRYTPTTCFETFPFPRPTPAQEAAIAAAAKELNELRERWLNPPEWTQTRTLEFPGSVNSPWARYVDPKTMDAKTGVGTVGYPRLEPRDAECAAKLKKRTLTNLYNERPAWLDLAHKRLDAAVAAAYGWPADLTDEQILERLLALNLERAAEEAKAPKADKPRVSRPKREDELL